MRIALAQTNTVWENKTANIQKMEEVIRAVKDKEVELVFFPEMTFTGFSMNVDVTAETDRFTLKHVQKFVDESGISIGAGWVEKTVSLCENHYSIVSPDGVISDYVKIHPFSYSGEDMYFKGGDKLSVCKLDDMTVGTLICYDLRFPEVFQKLSESCDMIVVTGNWPESRREHWIALLKARAIETQCYIAGVNCAGMVGDRFYSGDSMIYAPDGKLLLPDEIFDLCENVPEEKIQIYDISNDVSAYRESFPVKKDRRNQLYIDLYNMSGKANISNS